MQDKAFRTWRDFQKEEHRRFGTVQLSIDEFAHDLYFDERIQVDEESEEELNFD